MNHTGTRTLGDLFPLVPWVSGSNHGRVRIKRQSEKGKERLWDKVRSTSLIEGSYGFQLGKEDGDLAVGFE